MPIRAVHFLSDDLIDQLVALYQREWWCQGRARDDVCTMLDRCDVVGLVDDSELVGFARAVSDRVYKALVLDVIVAPSRRGEGLGDRAVSELAAHPNLQAVRHFELYCRPDMGAFYERHGYQADLGDLQLMRYPRLP